MASRAAPDADFDFGAEGYGAAFKKAVRDGTYGISLGAFGESLARQDNYVAIDPTERRLGIPALRISMTHGDNEAALMHEDAAPSRRGNAGSCRRQEHQVRSTVRKPGMAIHELGTARMGNGPEEVCDWILSPAARRENVLVTDGASFVSSGCQNPTLTMMAITVRACDHLIGRFRTDDVCASNS